MRYSILMLTHNRIEAVKACLASLVPTLSRNDVVLHVLDNHSTDGTAELITHAPGIESWRYNDNYGVARGRQMMLEDADLGDIVVFLDSDVIIQDAGWLDKLAAALAPEPVGIAGPAGSYVFWNLPAFAPDFVPAPVGECDVVSGWCQAFKREVVQAGAGLDVGYGMFWEEDSDFCMQIRALGWDVVNTGDIGVLHTPGKSGDTGNRAVNLRRFWDKWHGRELTKTAGAY